MLVCEYNESYNHKYFLKKEDHITFLFVKKEPMLGLF